jgi:hypothetical protein
MPAGGQRFLKWRWVVGVAVLTVLWLSFDFAWRVVHMPFRRLVLVFGLCSALVVAALLLPAWLAQRWNRKAPTAR